LKSEALPCDGTAFRGSISYSGTGTKMPDPCAVGKTSRNGSQ
jgi:hypothetical protein